MTTPSRPSRFGQLRALKEAGQMPPEPESAAAEPQAGQEAENPVPSPDVKASRPRAQRGAQTVEPGETRRVGRPLGKRAAGDYVQLTSYVPEAVHFDAVTKLRNENRKKAKPERRDFSDIVEALLAGWLSGQFKV